LAPSCTSRRYGQTFSSLCVYLHAFMLPHALHIKQPFSGFSGISNTHSNLGFAILILHCLILLAFLMLIDQKSTCGTCHFLGSTLVCWSTRKQSSITQSTVGSEYVATTSCCSQIIWIVHTMRDYGVTYKSVPLMCDNSSAIF
jgi:hypothetical protein